MYFELVAAQYCNNSSWQACDSAAGGTGGGKRWCLQLCSGGGMLWLIGDGISSAWECGGFSGRFTRQLLVSFHWADMV